MSSETAEQPRTSVSVDLADLAVEQLTNLAWSLPFEAARTWSPEFHLEDLVGARIVCVVPRTVRVTRFSRGANLHEPICEIGIMYKPDVEELAEEATTDELTKVAAIIDQACDEQAGLVEELIDYFNSPEGRSYGNVGPRALKMTLTAEVTTLISPDYLEKYNQVTSVVRLTARVAKR